MDTKPIEGPIEGQRHAVKDLVVDQFSHGLRNLKTFLLKARTYAEERKFDENNYLGMRLAPDMFPLVKQVQITTDIAKGTAARLSGKTAPVFEDKETTVTELLTRIDRAIEFLQTLGHEDFKNYPSTKASFPWKPGVFLAGQDLYITHAIPNFYFHMTTTYALLRHAGVVIGKGDFLGEQPWQKA